MSNYYFSEKPKSKLETKEIQINIEGEKLKFVSPSAVFSYGKIDKASFTLVKNCHVSKGAKVLDLGCGYGFIGITLAKMRDDIELIFTDINERAVFFCKKNIKLNKLSNERAKVLQGDMFEPVQSEMFDVILSNPPMHAGRKMCYQVIDEAKNHLKKQGSLQLVARHQRGGKMLMQHMQEQFGNVETLAKEGGFRVYKSILA